MQGQYTGPLGDTANVEQKNGTGIMVTGAPVATPGPGGPGSPTSANPGGTPDPDDRNGNGTPDLEETPFDLRTPSGTSGPEDGTPGSEVRGDGTPGPGQGSGDADGASGSSESGDEPSAAGVMLWTLIGLAALGGAGALGFFVLRRRGML
jgi:hypothetical protein